MSLAPRNHPGTSVHGLPASTDADFSERQRTACPHCDSITSCGVSHTVWFQSLLAPKKNRLLESRITIATVRIDTRRTLRAVDMCERVNCPHFCTEGQGEIAQWLRNVFQKMVFARRITHITSFDNFPSVSAVEI